MAETVIIAGSPFPLPESGQDPDWSSSVTNILRALAQTLAVSLGTYDVSPQVYSMVADINSNVTLPNLSFSTSAVRGATIRYTVYRTSTATTVTEYGDLKLVFNPTGSSGNKWEVSRTFVGNANITFVVTDAGQVTFSSTTISGTGHVGQISYAAQALEQA